MGTARARFLKAALLLLATHAAASAAGPTITLIPDLPGGTDNSVATGVSDDGSVVSGYTFFPSSRPRAFRWMETGGTMPLGQSPSGLESAAFGISRDGATLVGYDVDSSGAQRAVAWNAAGVMVPLSGPTPVGNTAASATSADGSIIVGEVSRNITRWIGGIQSTHGSGQAFGASADGSVMVGRTGSLQAFRWTAPTGVTPLGFLPGGNNSFARATSADGAVVVGGSNSGTGGIEAVRWTAANGIQSIGQLGTGSTFATATTADGSIIVGDGNGQQTAFIWDALNGMRSLADAMQQDYGLELNGFALQSAQGISADGQFIVGFTGEFGDRTAWIIQLPEPHACVACALGMILIGRRRNRGMTDRRSPTS